MRRLAAALASLALAACATGSESPATSLVTTTAAAPTTTTTVPPEPATTTTTLAPEPAGPTTGALEEGWALAGTVSGPLEVYVFPGAPWVARTVDAATILGTPTVVMVLEGPEDGWARVMLPGRPNGATGWVRSSDLELHTVDRRVEIDLDDRRLEVIVDGASVLETAVAVGTSSNPTPTGTFFVTDTVATGNPGGPWGPFAFGLSARSDTITEFNGGDGIIAIHGTSNPASIGNAASLGCVRVPNEVSEQLWDILAPGVPVVIRP